MVDDEDDRQMLCERCRKFVLLSQIKYISKGDNSKMALCKTCLKNFNIPGSKKESSAAGSVIQSTEQFFCGRCNYKFKVSVDKKSNLRCPYCGKSDRISSEKKRSTETLLAEETDF